MEKKKEEKRKKGMEEGRKEGGKTLNADFRGRPGSRTWGTLPRDPPQWASGVLPRLSLSQVSSPPLWSVGDDLDFSPCSPHAPPTLSQTQFPSLLFEKNLLFPPLPPAMLNHGPEKNCYHHAISLSAILDANLLGIMARRSRCEALAVQRAPHYRDRSLLDFEKVSFSLWISCMEQEAGVTKFVLKSYSTALD